MAGLPSGTVTFLFTDIEGSTRLWERHPEAMRLALGRHESLLREAITAREGHVFKTVGDAVCAAFAAATRSMTISVLPSPRTAAPDPPVLIVASASSTCLAVTP